MSASPRQYTLVFDLVSASNLLRPENHNLVQALVNTQGDLSQIRPDPFVETILRTEDLFYSGPVPDKSNMLSEAENLEELKRIYSELEHDVDTSSVQYPTCDYRFSKIDFLMFSGSNKNQLLSKTLGFGVIRLFISEDENSSEFDESAKSDGTVLAILAVPSYFSSPDLFGFIGDEGREKIKHFRIFRSENPSRFMVLMKFNSKEDADEFQKNNNGREFSSLEPETCQVVSIEEIRFRSNRLNSPPGSKSSYDSSSSSSSQAVRTSDEFGSSLIELPTCPICLERMDTSISGLITSSCLHTFHCMCLWKWKGGNCPVCRSSSLDERKRVLRNQRRCSICSTTNNLWLCLICGNILCGRYDSAHAVNHFKSTDHCYAIDLNTQSVWDYAEDRYVHRLIRNETDGKIVELPSRDDQLKKKKNNNDNSYDGSGKNDNELLITLLLNIIQNGNEEYNEVKDENVVKQQELVEQMEQLEIHQQSVIKNMKTQHEREMKSLKESITSMKTSLLSEFRGQMISSESLSKELRLENSRLKDELAKNTEKLDELTKKLKLFETTVPDLEKSMKKNEKKIKELQNKNEKVHAQLAEEKELSEALSKQLDLMGADKQRQILMLVKEKASLEQTIKDLEEQNSDLMMSIDFSQKISNNDELKNGDVSIQNW